MVDPIVREKARQLFIDEGFGTDSISKMLDCKITRSTINYWRKEEGWDEIRKTKIERSANLRERLERLLETAVTEAESNMNPKAIFTIGKLVAALRASSYFDFTDERVKKESGQTKKFTKEKLAEIEKELGVL